MQPFFENLGVHDVGLLAAVHHGVFQSGGQVDGQFEGVVLFAVFKGDEVVVVEVLVGDGVEGGVEVGGDLAGLDDDWGEESLVGKECRQVIDDGDGWLTLLEHELDDGLGGSGALVVDGGVHVAVLEDLQAGEARDVVFHAQFLVLGTVDLGEGDVFVGQRLGGLDVLWGHVLTVATPWGKEFCEHEVVRLDVLVEGVGGQLDHGGVFRGHGLLLGRDGGGEQQGGP